MGCGGTSIPAMDALSRDRIQRAAELLELKALLLPGVVRSLRRSVIALRLSTAKLAVVSAALLVNGVPETTTAPFAPDATLVRT